MIPETLTGCPERRVGLNLAPRAAATAAACKSGWPPAAEAETTLPVSSISTCTCTAPLARTARAAAGYVGFGRLIALPFRTPPEMVFGGAFLIGAGGGSPPPVSLSPPLPTLPVSLPVP